MYEIFSESYAQDMRKYTYLKHIYKHILVCFKMIRRQFFKNLSRENCTSVPFIWKVYYFL